MELQELVKKMLVAIGEDPERNGLVRTPERVAKAYAFLTKGYHEDPKTIMGEGVFDVETEEMVVVRDIDFFSLCEHHMMPFFGRAHVAYIPKGRMIGLSKIPRIIEIFARRLQVQERLTSNIAETLEEILAPHGVAVVLEGQHLCMMMRGIQKINSLAVTSSVSGVFREQQATRAEFMNLIKVKR